MVVQIYEVTSLTEAKRLVELGVDHVGVLVGLGTFPRERSSEQAREIFSAVKFPAKKVALSLSADIEEIERVISETNPDIVHIGAAIELFSPDQTKELKANHPNISIMRAIPVTGPEAVAWAREYEGIADWLLLDSHKAGDAQIGALGVTHDWNVSREIVATVTIPAILAGGLGPDNVRAAIDAVNPAGVDSKTKTDLSDGSAKDLEKVRRFIEGARTV